MKIRNDFVTNSSSSSFIILKQGLTDYQLKALRNPGKYAEEILGKDFDCVEYAGDWEVFSEDELKIKLYTFMDNFSIGRLADAVEIPAINQITGE